MPSVRDRFPAPYPSCLADGQPRSVEQLRVRTMNFGQHWRTPGIEEVTYQAALPGAFLRDFLERQVPEWVADSRQHPNPRCALETALREAGWPSPAAIVETPTLAHAALAYFAHDLLLEWLGDGQASAEPSFVVNTVTSVSLEGEVAVLEGKARRSNIPVRYQDA